VKAEVLHSFPCVKNKLKNVLPSLIDEALQSEHVDDDCCTDDCLIFHIILCAEIGD